MNIYPGSIRTRYQTPRKGAHAPSSTQKDAPKIIKHHIPRGHGKDKGGKTTQSALNMRMLALLLAIDLPIAQGLRE